MGASARQEAFAERQALRARVREVVYALLPLGSAFTVRTARFTMMRQHGWPALLALAGALMLTVVGTTARADAPISYVQQVDETFPSEFWTSACGILVLRHQAGTLRVSIHEGASSAHEIDTFADWTDTVMAPSTGRSFTQASGPVRTDYPEGIYLGAPAQIADLGRELSAPGLPQDAGREVYSADVVFISDGLPFTEITGLESIHGHFNDFEDYVAAGRLALGC
jgi:hypothetical protein